MLRDRLPSHDRFLFLPEPLYLLLNPDRLLLCRGFVFFSFLIPILHLDLIQLSFGLGDLYWQRFPRGRLVWSTSIGLGGASSSAVLAEACCGGGHADLL
jgi:hypothetical protein